MFLPLKSSQKLVVLAVLAGRAALKMGAGAVHVGLLADNAPVVDVNMPELMLHKATDLLHSFPHPNPPPVGEGVGGWGHQALRRPSAR